MATLPSNSDMTGSGVTEGGFKTALNSVLDFLRDTLGSTGTVAGVRTALGLGAMATKATVASGDINDGAVTTAKVADGAITAAKLAANAAIPAGTLVDFAGATAPAGWLLCYGQAVSRTTYAALFGAIGTTWGTGDGSTTFNLPDLRGRVRAGRDDMGGTAAGRLTNALTGNPGLDGTSLGAAGGVDRHTLTTAQMPSHNHVLKANTGAGGTPVANTTLGSVFNDTAVIGNAGDGEAHPNVQPTAIVNSIIKT